MNIINSKNIDEWLFNYFEGNLTSTESEQLMTALNKNPALKVDYDTWKISYIKEPEMVYPGINQLIKPEGIPIKWIIGSILGCALFVSIYYLTTAKNSITTVNIPNNTLPAKTIYKNKTLITDSSSIHTTKNNKTALTKQTKPEKVTIVNTHEMNTEKEMFDSTEKFIPITSINNQTIILNKNSASELLPITIDSIIEKNTFIKDTHKNDSEGDKHTSKHKKRRKEMNIIRLNNTGF